MVTTVLKKRGYDVDTAPDGEQAYERALSNPPDLLITDVMMPNVDGWALVRRMREHPALRHIPVIFLTALSSDDDRIHGFRLGADDYLPKPFRFEELDLRVARTLRRTQPAADSDDGAARPASAPETSAAAQLSAQRATSQAEPTLAVGSNAELRASTAADGDGHRRRPISGVEPAARPGDSNGEGGADGEQVHLETALAGNLSEIGLPMLLTMLEMEQKSGILILHHEQEGVAEIYLKAGRVIHATLDYIPGGEGGDDDDAEEEEFGELSWGMEDAECVYYLLKWTEGRFEFKPGDVQMEDRVAASITQLLMEGARRLDEFNETSRRMEALDDVESGALVVD